MPKNNQSAKRPNKAAPTKAAHKPLTYRAALRVAQKEATKLVTKRSHLVGALPQVAPTAKDSLVHTSIGLRLTGESAKSARFAQILELLLFPFTHGPSTWAGIFLTSALGAAIGFTLAFLYAKYIGGAP